MVPIRQRWSSIEQSWKAPRHPPVTPQPPGKTQDSGCGCWVYLEPVPLAPGRAGWVEGPQLPGLGTGPLDQLLGHRKAGLRGCPRRRPREAVRATVRTGRPGHCAVSFGQSTAQFLCLQSGDSPQPWGCVETEGLTGDGLARVGHGGVRQCPQGLTKQPAHPARWKGETGPSLLPHCPALPLPPSLQGAPGILWSAPCRPRIQRSGAPVGPGIRGAQSGGGEGSPPSGAWRTSLQDGGRVRGWTAARTPPAVRSGPLKARPLPQWPSKLGLLPEPWLRRPQREPTTLRPSPLAPRVWEGEVDEAPAGWWEWGDPELTNRSKFMQVAVDKRKSEGRRCPGLCWLGRAASGPRTHCPR